jgi:hypothetical protein
MRSGSACRIRIRVLHGGNVVAAASPPLPEPRPDAWSLALWQVATLQIAGGRPLDDGALGGKA